MLKALKWYRVFSVGINFGAKSQPLRSRVQANVQVPCRSLHLSACYKTEESSKSDTGSKFKYSSKESEKKREEEAKALTKFGHFFSEVPPDDRNKEAFHSAIGLYLERNVRRRGQVEFIYAALKHMREYGVLRDLETYKKLLDIFPKGKMIATNIYQLSMKHYPKHQDCCTDVLDQMEYYSCYPDKEVVMMVENAFGKYSFAWMKISRMMYWMPKFRYANPYRPPDPLPRDPLELAKLAIQRMCRDPANEVYAWYSEAMPRPPEKTWLVCGQSCHQRRLINEHPASQPLYVDGPFREWVYDQQVSYFTLLADASPHKWHGDIDPNEPETADEWANWSTKFSHEFPESRKALMNTPSIHEQQDGTVLSIGVTGSSSKDSLVCWIHFLQRMNPKLASIPVVFRLSHGIGELVVRDSRSGKAAKELTFYETR